MSAPCPELGFFINIALLPSVTDGESDALMHELAELLEANALMMGGGGDRVFELVVTRDGSQATQADRELLLEWARRHVDRAAITVSDIRDLSDA